MKTKSNKIPMSKPYRLASLLATGTAALALCLTGCGLGGAPVGGTSGGSSTNLAKGSINGNVHGGQNPVSGSAIQLYAVSSSGLGTASLALIPTADQVVYNGNANTGAMTDGTGNFRITNDYTCPVPSPQVYLVATGGNSGGGVNSSIALMAPLGDCATLAAASATTYVQINEVTTVASAYTLAPFMSSYTNVGAPTVNAPGLIHAVANFNSLVNLNTGLATGASLPPGAVVPASELNTLADILAACVNTPSSTSPACNTLGTATSATNTVGHALAIAKNPGSAAFSSLYGTIAGTGTPFLPTLSSAPADWSVAIKYTAGGALSAPYGIAIDASGDAYVSNSTGNSVTELGPTGAVVSTLNTGGLIGPKGVAIDRTGNIWIANPSSNSVVEFSSAGTLKSGSGYTVGGLNGPVAIAADSGGNAWVANLAGSSVTELSSTGAATQTSLSGSSTISRPTGIALDGSGNVYVANNGGGNVVKLANSNGAVVAGSPFTDSALQGTSSVAVDGSGNVWATGSTTGPAVAGAASQFGSTGTAASYSPLANGGLTLPAAVAISGTSAWIANNQTSGSLSQLLLGQTTPASPAAGLGSLNAPVGVAVDPSGNVWTANSGDNTVSVFIGLTSPVLTPLAANVGP